MRTLNILSRFFFFLKLPYTTSGESPTRLQPGADQHYTKLAIIELESTRIHKRVEDEEANENLQILILLLFFLMMNQELQMWSGPETSRVEPESFFKERFANWDSSLSLLAVLRWPGGGTTACCGCCWC